MEIQLSDFLIKGIGILIISVILGGFILGIFYLTRLLIKIKKLNQPEIFKYYFLMLLCILIMTASWLLNMGWYRIILTWLAFPIIHLVLFIIINGKILLKLFCSKALKVYTLLSYVSYLLFYLMLPDGGDIGTMYVLFNLLHNNTVAYIAGVLSVTSFFAHIVFTVFQLIEIRRLKHISK